MGLGRIGIVLSPMLLVHRERKITGRQADETIVVTKPVKSRKAVRRAEVLKVREAEWVRRGWVGYR